MRMMNTRSRLVAVLGLMLVAMGCGAKERYDQAICVLIDVSGTYSDQRSEVVRAIKREVLPTMKPGDTLLVVRIDGASYGHDNVEANVTLDARPSKANAQKLALAQRLDRFAKRDLSARHTDIPGAMMLGSEYLGELASGSRVMLIFSDMEEDLAPGTQRELQSDELDGVWVAAMNVKRLQRDNANPAVFRGRLADWKNRVLASGGRDFRVFMDPGKLSDYLSEVRES